MVTSKVYSIMSSPFWRRNRIEYSISGWLCKLKNTFTVIKHFLQGQGEVFFMPCHTNAIGWRFLFWDMANRLLSYVLYLQLLNNVKILFQVPVTIKMKRHQKSTNRLQSRAQMPHNLAMNTWLNRYRAWMPRFSAFSSSPWISTAYWEQGIAMVWCFCHS